VSKHPYESFSKSPTVREADGEVACSAAWIGWPVGSQRLEAKQQMGELRHTWDYWSPAVVCEQTTSFASTPAVQFNGEDTSEPHVLVFPKPIINRVVLSGAVLFHRPSMVLCRCHSSVWRAMTFANLLQSAIGLLAASADIWSI
jgi:hypothetical protein